MQLGIKNQKVINYHDLMTRVLKETFDGTLAQNIDKLPEEYLPAGSDPKWYDSFEDGLIIIYTHSAYLYYSFAF